DSMGNIQWNRCYGGSEKEGLLDILEVSDGYLAACQSGSNDGVFKLSDAQYAIAAQAMSYEWSCVEENDIVLFKITDTLINGISNNILTNLVKAYPSPAQQVINFDNAGPFPITMSIIDPLGVKKDELLLTPGSNSFQLINYCPGMYIYQYNTRGQIFTGKFIVY
ncbi:MAG: T9SS type A sorting domain-containing protein, partial [Lentimicrobiaceae bacterium]